MIKPISFKEYTDSLVKRGYAKQDIIKFMEFLSNKEVTEHKTLQEWNQLLDKFVFTEFGFASE